jgi:hypothetical protein
MTTYSNSLRFWEGTPGDPAIRNAWGTSLNTNFTLLDSSITGLASVNIAGLLTYSLTSNNGAADQSRELMQDYTGALAGDCTVTIPNVQKVGWARNSTTGSHNVLLTSGGGTQATVPPNGVWYWYWCDGSTNVVLTSVGFGTLRTSGALTVGGAATVGSTLLVTGFVTCSSSIGVNGTTAGSVAGAGQLLTSGAGTGASGPIAYSISCAGSITGTAIYATSDARAKSEIEEITPEQAVAYVMAGRSVTFRMDGCQGAGFIAQEEIATVRRRSINLLEDARPEFADGDGIVPAGHRLVKSYEHDIAFLTAALQNALGRIAALEARPCQSES